MSDEKLPSEPEPTSDVNSEEQEATAAHARFSWPWVKRLLLRFARYASVLFLFLAITIGLAGWYTSRSDFCNSCHIMEPYYNSWKQSSHKDVACIECHFAPGFAEKIRGKMLGLVQLAKYVTKSEGPRPAAEIPDASCLRSGCHETRLMSGKVDFHGVPFDHEPHLKELRREKKLRCTSCHSMFTQDVHMSVSQSTCFLCHFKDEPFNEGLGACTRCHQIPEKEFDLGGGVHFTHELAYERGVDCANCHADVIRGNGQVPPERCRVCHHRPDDLKKIDDHVFIHQTHVTDHKIECTDCHLEIQHSLDKQRLVHAAADCQSCHPHHHREQIEMFDGTGAMLVSDTAGGMTVTRVDCRTCHRTQQTTLTGSTLWTASAEVCAMCHEAQAVEALDSYYAELKATYGDIESALAALRKTLGSSDLPKDSANEVRERLDKVEHDLAFLREGGGIHNIHFANELSQTLVEQLNQAAKQLGAPPPKVALPELADRWK